MSLGLLFWVLMILRLIFSISLTSGVIAANYVWGGPLLDFVLLFILGWQNFGPPVRRGPSA